MKYAAVLLYLLVYLFCLLRTAVSAPPTLYAYIPTGETLHAYRVADSGALTPLSSPTITLTAPASTFAVHPSQRHLYASHSSEERKPGAIQQYRVNADGTLTPLSPATVAVPGPIRELIMHPGGKLLYVTGNDGMLHIYRIGADGRLSPLKPAKVWYTFFVPSGPDDAPGAGEREGHQFSIEPNGKYAYNFVVDGFSDHVELYLQRYRIGTDGQLTPLGKRIEWTGENKPPRILPGYLTFAPKARLAFTTYTGSSLYRVGSDGTFTPFTPRQITMPKKSPDDYAEESYIKAIDPLGRFLYVSATESYDLEEQEPNYLYRLNPGGRKRLEPTIARGSLLIEPHGRFAYAIEIAEGNRSYGIKAVRLTTYRILADGRLGKIAAPPVVIPHETDIILFVKPPPATP
jgi:6-phosphogluconolactonase (cycloisomerase 2 family)